MAADRAAKTYTSAAVLQHEIADRLVGRLDFMKIIPNVVLDCGARDGYATKKIKKHYPTAIVIATDFSERFLQLLKNRFQLRHKIKTICGHCQLLPFEDSSIDIIFSNLWLHWEKEIHLCFREFFRVLKPNGLFLFSILGPDTLKELRQSFSLVGSCNHVHEFVDMHDIGDLLLRNGFSDPVMDMEYLTINYSSIHSLFSDLKKTGSSNARMDRQRGLLGKIRWLQMITNYEQLCKNEVYPATFEIIYGQAWTHQSKLGRQNKNEISIPLDSIKTSFK